MLFFILVFTATLASSCVHVSAIEWEIPGVPEWITYLEDTYVDDVFEESEVDAHTIRFYAEVGVVEHHNANGDGLSFCVTSAHRQRPTCCHLPKHVQEGQSYMCDMPFRDQDPPLAYSITALRHRHKHGHSDAACWSGFSIVVGKSRDYTLVYSGTMLAGFGFPWQLNTEEAAKSFGELETVCAWMARSRPGWVERMEIYNVSGQSTYLYQGSLELAEENLKIIRSPCRTDACGNGPAHTSNISLLVGELNFERAVEHQTHRSFPLVKLDLTSVYLGDTNQLLQPCGYVNSTGEGDCFIVEQHSRRLIIFRNGSPPPRVYSLVEASYLQTNAAEIGLHHHTYLQLFVVLVVVSLFFHLS